MPAAPNQPEALLVAYYRRNGCMRRPNRRRRKKEKRKYKMGYEIRLVARTKLEIDEIRGLLAAVGLKPGNPYAKVHQWVVPVYGKAAMEQFKSWLKEFR